MNKYVGKIAEYAAVVFKAGGAIILGGLQWGYSVAVYAFFDISYELYRKYQDNKQQDLSEKRARSLERNQKKLEAQRDADAKRFEEFEHNQVEFQKQILAQKTSVGFLNRLINEGFIRESELLKLAGSSSYYQVIVYGIPVSKLVQGLNDFPKPKRRYPIFLESLGFVRLGVRANTFLLSKKRLQEQTLKNNTAEFKRFLADRFSHIRKQEWSDFLEVLKEEAPDRYEKLKDSDCISEGVLQINFLLTEMNINMTNMGYVDGEVVGIADTKNDRKLSEQLLAKADPSNISLSDDIKVRIREIMLELDIGFLLDEVSLANRKKLAAGQADIKNHLGINSVIEIHNCALEDVVAEFSSAGLSAEDANGLGCLVRAESGAYSDALRELGVVL